MAEGDNKKAADESAPVDKAIQKQLDALTKGLETVKSENTELRKKSEEAVKSIGTLNKTLGNLQAENKELRKQLDKKPDATEAVAEEKPKIPEQPFTVEGLVDEQGRLKKFQFTIAAFLHKKAGSLTAVKVTAKDALTDPALLAELVAKGSGVIKEVA